ncbi:MAG: NAD-binding protein [Polyangiaceae bacterium]
MGQLVGARHGETIAHRGRRRRCGQERARARWRAMVEAATRTKIERTWRWVRWRAMAIVVVFALGLVAFELGVGVSDRAGVPEGGTLTHAYYALGLFVLGGLDLGMPVAGPVAGRAMLWFAYFAAPAITASAVTEAVLRAMRPQRWALMRLRHHVVFAGAGKLTMQALRKLRQRWPRKPVLIVERSADHPSLDEAQTLYDAVVVVGDIASDGLLATLRLERADRFLALTGDDFVNLDAASKLLAQAPHLENRIVAHVADLHFLRIVEETRLSRAVTVFNTHQIAAKHLVNEHLLAHFHDTERLDTVIIGGFGRFGQTVLDQLQKHALHNFDRVILVDMECARRALVFEEQVGFGSGYAYHVVDGDIADPAMWKSIDERFDLGRKEATFVIGSGSDGTNLHVAMWLKVKWPSAMVVARSFRRSAFAEEVSAERDIACFSVAELVDESIPEGWLG